MLNFPKQRLPYSKKVADNYAWVKQVVDSILSYAPTNGSVVNNYQSPYERMLSNYQLYNNQINQADFERECNPLGLDVGQFKDAIQPYNKTYTKIQLLLSDEYKRPFNYRTILTNSEGIRSKLAYKDSLIRNYIESQIQSTIQSLSEMYRPETLETVQDSIIHPSKVEEYMKTSYRDKREILSQHILQYLTRRLDLPDLKNDAFKHALISGRELVYVGVKNGEPYVEVVNPLGFDHHKGNETKWVQDSLYASYSVHMTPAEVLDKYHLTLTDEDKDKVDAMSSSTHALREFKMGPTAKYGNTEYDPHPMDNSSSRHGAYGPSDNNLLVAHVEWMSQKKVGFVTYYNEYGELQEDIVSEDFVIPVTYSKRKIEGPYNSKRTEYYWEMDGVEYSIRWDYIPEVWTATKIGTDIYTMIGPKEMQFRSVDNPYKVSLGYHGVLYNATNADPISPMDRMKPFQYLYLIVMHKLKKLIAQDQGKVFHYDMSMVDPKIGLEKSLYYLKELNIDFFNPLMNGDEPGHSQRGKIASETDMSNMQYIINYISILSAIDNQISEVAGVSREREGQTTANAAVTNAQANIHMSTLNTELYFKVHSKLWEKVCESLVAAAKHAWKDRGVVKQYVLDDMSLSTLVLDQGDLSDCDLGVFITDNGKEYEMFQALKSFADGLLNTNRATFSDLISLYEANSSAELKSAIKQSEQEAQQREQDAQQAEIQSRQQLQQEQQQFELQQQERQFAHEIELAQIDVFKFQKDIDIDDNGIPDPLEVQKFISDEVHKKQQLAFEKKKFEKEAELKEKELKIKARKPTSK